MTAEVTGGSNIRVSVKSFLENMGSCRVSNYFPQLVGFRPDQLTLINWGELVGDGILKENKLITGILTVCTSAGIGIHHLDLFSRGSKREVIRIISMLFFYCDREARYCMLVN